MKLELINDKITINPYMVEGFSVDPNYTAITTIGLITLTNDVTEADLKAVDRVSGKIIISATTNVLVYNKMKANLAKNQVIEFK